MYSSQRVTELYILALWYAAVPIEKALPLFRCHLIFPSENPMIEALKGSVFFFFTMYGFSAYQHVWENGGTIYSLSCQFVKQITIICKYESMFAIYYEGQLKYE